MTSLSRSVRLMVDRLVRNRNIPKYQYERALEPFLSLFLEEALEHFFRMRHEFIVAEFPLKKPGNAQSTNADFLFRQECGHWLLVEMKTERTTLRPAQIAVYQSLAGKKFNALVESLEVIRKATKQKSKYAHLLSELEKHRPYSGQVSVLYITPHKNSPLRGRNTAIQWCSFDDLFKPFKSKEHPELWEFVSMLVDAV